MPEEAGLTSVGRSFPLSALFPQPEWYGDLIRTARSVYEEQPEIAIVISQIAVETYVELALAALLRNEGKSDPQVDAALNGIPSFNFRKDDAVHEWRRLTGNQVKQTAEWPGYVRHVNRRNLIVHRGQRATKAEASDSIEASARLIQHMQNVLKPILA